VDRLEAGCPELAAHHTVPFDTYLVDRLAKNLVLGLRLRHLVNMYYPVVTLAASHQIKNKNGFLQA
jgi:hypothetical protein